MALSEAEIDAAEIKEFRRLDERMARATKDWAESDRLRDHLAALGVAIKDNKDGRPRPGSSSDERRLASPLSAARRATLRRDLSLEHR